MTLLKHGSLVREEVLCCAACLGPSTGRDHQWPQAEEEQKSCMLPLAQFVEGDGGHMP